MAKATFAALEGMGRIDIAALEAAATHLKP